VLLERLGPWLAVARRHLPARPPYLDAEDVAQELTLEVLRIAAGWRPHCEDRWVPRRLVERAARHVYKIVLREQFSAAEELNEDTIAGEPSSTDIAFDTPVGKASASELLVLYRFKVLGEPIEKLAHQSGLTTGAVRRLIRRALAHARTATPGSLSE